MAARAGGASALLRQAFENKEVGGEAGPTLKGPLRRRPAFFAAQRVGARAVEDGEPVPATCLGTGLAP